MTRVLTGDQYFSEFLQEWGKLRMPGNAKFQRLVKRFGAESDPAAVAKNVKLLRRMMTSDQVEETRVIFADWVRRARVPVGDEMLKRDCIDLVMGKPVLKRKAREKTLN